MLKTFLAHSMNELMQSRGVCRLSVRPSVNFYTQAVATSTTNMTGSPPYLHNVVPTRAASRVCSRSRSRSHDTGTSVMSRNVCYTVPSDVLSLHALTLRSTVTLSFQYKCQTATCNVYIMEWATPSLMVWLCLSMLNTSHLQHIFNMLKHLQKWGDHM